MLTKCFPNPDPLSLSGINEVPPLVTSDATGGYPEDAEKRVFISPIFRAISLVIVPKYKSTAIYIISLPCARYCEHSRVHKLRWHSLSLGMKDFCIHSIHATVDMGRQQFIYTSVFSNFRVTKRFPGERPCLEIREEDPKSTARYRKTP